MDDEQKNLLRGWEKFLDPQKLRRSLIEASVFIAAYEILKDEIVGRTKSFFTLGQHAPDFQSDYEREVLALHKNPFKASCLWLQKVGAITGQDLDLLSDIAKHRNEIAHELPKLIVSHELDVDRLLLASLNHLVTKISLWWVLEVEVPANPDFDGVEVKEKDVLTGPMMFMQIVMAVFND
jgi:hypothetical protein